MSAEQVFLLAQNAALVCWLFLALSLFYEKFRRLAQWLGSFGMPLLLGVTYIAAMSVGQPVEQGGFGSLAEVRLIFGSDWILLAGWVHYLVFDFFVGAWIVRNSLDEQVSPFLILPCLFLCLMAGPVGLLLYLIIRSGRRMMNPHMA